jgi:formate-dependent nitrite reductase membrane component NrfD
MDLVLYLLTKGISTGALFLGAILWLMGDRSALSGLAAPLVSSIFCALTAGVLVMDLERPERFYYILTRPNSSGLDWSWVPSAPRLWRPRSDRCSMVSRPSIR